MQWQLITSRSWHRDQVSRNYSRPTEHRSGSLHALAAIAHVDAAVMMSGCDYCRNPRLYHALPGGCPCRRTETRSRDDYGETRDAVTSGRTPIEYFDGCTILDIR